MRHAFPNVLAIPGLLALAALILWSLEARSNHSAPELSFTNIASQAGLKAVTIYAGEKANRYLVETTGCGVALLDFDGDGWLDIYQVNGWRFDGLPAPRPQNHLYRNNRDGTFTDVAAQAGVGKSGWGQAVCLGDYDNDGFVDLFVTYWGVNVLYRNNGDGTFTDTTAKAGLAGKERRWSTGCAFLDYDRDGDLDLFVSHYIVFDPRTAPEPGTNPYCQYRGLPVNCGPRGLDGETSALYRNDGASTFTDVSEQAGVTRPGACYGLGVLVCDFDNDGWPDVYVANDTNPSVLFHNNRNGTFADIAVLAGCAFDENWRKQA